MSKYDNLIVHSDRESLRRAVGASVETVQDESNENIVWLRTAEETELIPHILDQDFIRSKVIEDSEKSSESSDDTEIPSGSSSIQGPKGEKGDQGEPGKSVYDLALEQGLFNGTEEEFMKLLVMYKFFTKDGIQRKTLELENCDNISGKDTEGKGHNLVMLSKWNVADFGAVGVHCNLNGKLSNPTYNDKRPVILADDLVALGLVTQEQLTEYFKSTGMITD